MWPLLILPCQPLYQPVTGFQAAFGRVSTFTVATWLKLPRYVKGAPLFSFDAVGTGKPAHLRRLACKHGRGSYVAVYNVKKTLLFSFKVSPAAPPTARR